MICRKATVALPDANYLSSRCQSLSSRARNRHFCALLPSETPIFGHFEHKIGVFVLFWPSEPSFSSLSSTKSRFLCAFVTILWAPYRYESNAETLSPQLKNNIIICIVISCQYLGVVLQRVNDGGSILCLLFYFSLHWR